MYTPKSISLCFVALLLSTTAWPVFADIVHKWVDAQGVTHYSDQLPENHTTSLKQIPISNIYSNAGKENYQEDYYSVTNQWARMREERIERKQLQLAKKKQKTAQHKTPEVVYVNQAEAERSRNIYYPAYLGRYGFTNHKNLSRYAGKNYINRSTHRNSGASCRLPRNSYSRSGASLRLTFR